MTTTQTAAKVTASLVHYGTPTVHVEAYRAQDVRGYEVEVHTFHIDGGMTIATGLRIKKDGTTAARMQVVIIPTPASVSAALAAL